MQEDETFEASPEDDAGGYGKDQNVAMFGK